MKFKKTMQETDSSSTYKKCISRELYCAYCPPGKGCNRMKENHNSWKKHRKTQWYESR